MIMLAVCEFIVAGQLGMAPGVVLQGPVTKKVNGVHVEMVLVRFRDHTRWMNDNSCFYREAKNARGKSSEAK